MLVHLTDEIEARHVAPEERRVGSDCAPAERPSVLDPCDSQGFPSRVSGAPGIGRAPRRDDAGSGDQGKGASAADFKRVLVEFENQV